MNPVHPGDVAALNALIVPQQQEQPVGWAETFACIPEGAGDHWPIPSRSNAEIWLLSAGFVNHIPLRVESLGGVPSLTSLVHSLVVNNHPQPRGERALPVEGRNTALSGSIGEEQIGEYSARQIIGCVPVL